MPAFDTPSPTPTPAAPEDYASRLALAQPLRHLREGTASGTDLTVAVHGNFARIIEQNFAQASPAQAARWLDTVEARSLATLAQAYVNATEHRSRAPLALDILAHRLDGPRLARLAAAVGHQRLRAAVMRAAPTQLPTFDATADPRATGPQPGEMNLHRHLAAPLGAGVFLDHGIEEIFLSFRTAPRGAASAAAALYQTGVAVGGALATARNPGARIGACLSLGAQLFPAPVWEPLAPRVSAWLQAFLRAERWWPLLSHEERQARLQREGCTDIFELPAASQAAWALEGGDYRCTWAWAARRPDRQPAMAAP